MDRPTTACRPLRNFGMSVSPPIIHSLVSLCEQHRRDSHHPRDAAYALLRGLDAVNWSASGWITAQLARVHSLQPIASVLWQHAGVHKHCAADLEHNLQHRMHMDDQLKGRSTRYKHQHGCKCLPKTSCIQLSHSPQH